ncbi:AAA family ATPase [Xenorhabdus nematophila]|uniref:AAA family ATPase n=1 Tax=Xenorhabdus nematophila TaxID=628 RepID=UPI0032B86802
MQLISFRVKNFRSVFDSGVITTDRLTAVLGRNESGKTNLLLALKSLNPAEGFGVLNKVKDFPRHRLLDDCTPSTQVVESSWVLSSSERDELSSIYPRAQNITSVSINRSYDRRSVGFYDLADFELDTKKIKRNLTKIATQAEVFFGDSERNTEQGNAELKAIKNLCDGIIFSSGNYLQWATNAKEKPQALRRSLMKNGIELKDELEDSLLAIEEKISEVLSDEERNKAAREWVVKNMPVFILVDDYPEINGHHNMAAYLQRQANKQLTTADINFEKLCKVAGIRPEELAENKEYSEVRNQLVNRSGAVVTSEIKRLWKDRSLKIRFNVDGDFFDTYVSDPSHAYDVEVNLDERSRGFKWFFSFYISFVADTKGGSAENAIILLDEPGLYLHAKSQTDLLDHLSEDFTNQIIYTTHSPFLVPLKNISAVKTVSITEEKGTAVTNDPSGDSTTLFPLQAALGYDIAQSLFIGSHNLIVEGVTDFWYLSSISDYLNSLGRKGLNGNITITPAGGAQRVSYMVSLLSSQNLSVIVLLDDEKQSRETSKELQQQGMLSRKNVLFVSEALDETRKECDIEDLFNRDNFIQFVCESYDLEANTLTLNENIPRIVKQFEKHLSGARKTFIKAKPARVFLNRMKDGNNNPLQKEELNRFEKLFELVNKRMSSRK